MGFAALVWLNGGTTRHALELHSRAGTYVRWDTHSHAAGKLGENRNPGCLLRSEQRLKILLLFKVFLDQNGVLNP